MIPESIIGIFNFVCKIPVINPAPLPIIIAIIVAIIGGTLKNIKIATTQQPSGKVPYILKSAVSNILYAI